MKSLLNALKEEDRLRILIKEIEKDDEATKDFKSQHLNNIQSFLKATEIPDDWSVILCNTDVNPFLSKVHANFDVGNAGRSYMLLFTVESYIYEDLQTIYIKNLTVYFRNFIFMSEKPLSDEEFNKFLKMFFEFIQKQNKKGGDIK